MFVFAFKFVTFLSRLQPRGHPRVRPTRGFCVTFVGIPGPAVQLHRRRREPEPNGCGGGRRHGDSAESAVSHCLLSLISARSPLLLGIRVAVTHVRVCCERLILRETLATNDCGFVIDRRDFIFFRVRTQRRCGGPKAEKAN